LSLWIDAAESQRVPVTDDVIRSQTKIIQSQLVQAAVNENYENFELSSGWLANFKTRFNIGRLKNYSDAPTIDESMLPIWRRQIAEQLAPFAENDRYNCDESGLVYNKQPKTSNVRKEKGKLIAVGGKDDKLRISTFHIVNSTGTDKRKLWVVGRAMEPHAFKRNRINTGNLPVIYRSNKKAWMITSLWFEFLRNLNVEMRIERRHIALVTDNCPTHPNPANPPLNWTGPTPPELTNVTLVFLPPNTTSQAILQPLDQGIIRSFKAAYRRRYADNMVQHFNLHAIRPDKIDILQAIYLMSDAWDSVTKETVIRCWKKANICGENDLNGPDNCQNMNPNIEQDFEDHHQHFIARERNYCHIAMREIFEHPSIQRPDPDFPPAFEEFFNYDEDNEEPLPNNELKFPDAAVIVQRGIAEGVLLKNPDELDRFLSADNTSQLDDGSISDSESSVTTAAVPQPLPIITIDGAIHYANELTRYLQSMKITELYTPSGKELSVSELSTKTVELRNALFRHKATSNTRQTSINNFFKPALLVVPGSSVINSDYINLHYPMEPSDYIDERQSNCVPTVWRSSSGGEGSSELENMYRRLLE
jgi:hypothetical protein